MFLSILTKTNLARQARSHAEGNMQMSKKLCAILCLIFFAWMPALTANAQPKIPRSDIPKDLPKEVLTQVELLYSSDPLVRGKAAVELGKMGGNASGAISFLLDILDDSSPLAWKTTSILGSHTETGTSPGHEAAVALGKIGASAISPLLELLNEQSSSAVKLNIIHALRANFSYEIVHPLIAVLDDKDADVREAAVVALGAYKTQESIDTLLKTLSDKNTLVRLAAIKALGESGSPKALEPLVVQLNDDLAVIRMFAIKALENYDEPNAITAQIKGLRDPDVTVRQMAARSLPLQKSGITIDAFIEALQDVDAGVRLIAAEKLADTKSPKALAPLLKAIQDVDAEVRLIAAESLADTKSPEVLAPLLKALQDTNEKVRSAASVFFVISTDPIIIEPMFDCLEDSNASVKENAFNALAAKTEPAFAKTVTEFGVTASTRIDRNQAFTKTLTKYLKNNPLKFNLLLRTMTDGNRDYLKPEIKNFLRGIADPILVNQFIAAIKDESPDIRNYAAQALGNINDHRSLVALEEALNDNNSDVRNSAYDSLVNLGKPSVPIFIHRLKNPDSSIQEQSITALGEIKDFRATEHIISFLHHKNHNLRRCAVQALSAIKDPKAIEPLIDLLDDEALKPQVESSLSSMTGQAFVYDKAKWRQWLADGQRTFIDGLFGPFIFMASAPKIIFTTTNKGSSMLNELLERTWGRGSRSYRIGFVFCVVALLAFLVVISRATTSRAGEKRSLDSVSQETTTENNNSDQTCNKFVSANKLWRCPKCNELLEKKGLGTVWKPGEPIENVEGTATCGGCLSRYDQKDVYGGKYDYEEQTIVQDNHDYKGLISVVVFKLHSTSAPDNPENICFDILKKRYPNARLNKFYVIEFQGALTAQTGLALYKDYVRDRTLSDLGEQINTYSGEDVSGDDVVALFFK